MFTVGRGRGGRGRGRGGAEPPRRREDRDARDSLVAANRRLEHGGLPPTVKAARPPRGPRGRGRAGFGLPLPVRGRPAVSGANASGSRDGGWGSRQVDTYRPPPPPAGPREGYSDLPKKERDDRMSLPGTTQSASVQQTPRHQRFSPESKLLATATAMPVRPPAPRPVGLTLPPQIPRAYSPTTPVDMSYGGPAYLKPQQPEAGPSRLPARDGPSWHSEIPAPPPPPSSTTATLPVRPPVPARPFPSKAAATAPASSSAKPSVFVVKEEPLPPEERPPIQKLKFKPRVLGVKKASSTTPEVPDVPVREDEKMDLGGEIDELEEDTNANGAMTSAEGVLAFSRADLPKDLWSKTRLISSDARAAFRKQHIAKLSKEGKTVTQVFWRDDGVAFPWVRKAQERSARSLSEQSILLYDESVAKDPGKVPVKTTTAPPPTLPPPPRLSSAPTQPVTSHSPTPRPSPSIKEDRHPSPQRLPLASPVKAAENPSAESSNKVGKKPFLERVYGSTPRSDRYHGPWPYTVFLKIPDQWATDQDRAIHQKSYQDWVVAQAQIARVEDADGTPTRHIRLDHVHEDVLPISWAPKNSDAHLLNPFPFEALADEESVSATVRQVELDSLDKKEKSRIKKEKRAAKREAAQVAAEQASPAKLPKRSRSPSEVEEPLEEPRPEVPKKKKKKKTPGTCGGEAEEEMALDGGADSPQASKVLTKESLPIPLDQPVPPPPTTSPVLQELEHRILQKFASIDRWTRMLAEYPASAETLRKQIDRMQEEIFGLQQEIDAEKMRLKSAAK